MYPFRVGFGYDVHCFASGRELWLGGMQLEHTQGLLGHSDADVLIHAICDALLGAAGLRDIGFHFPDKDDTYKNIDSKVLLGQVMDLIRKEGYELGNVDATICAEQPKINPYIPDMIRCLADVMQVNGQNLSIKATTSEKMGFVGRSEGMSAYAIVLIYWK